MTDAAGTPCSDIDRGKFSLLRTVYRVLRPHTGQVRVGGDDAWALPVRQLSRTVAAVVQDSAADFHLVADLDG